MMKIKLDHINLTVSNLAESVDWYEKVFGFKLVERGVSSEEVPWAIVAQNDFMICMTEDKDRESAAKQDRQGHHQIYHFGVRVSDMNSWQNKIETYHLSLLYGGVIEYPYSKSWYIEDPNGHEIEVSYSGDQALSFPGVPSKEL